jgi:hypothetical protein
VLRPGDRIVKAGYFMYDGTVRCAIRIVQTDTIPGTGDFENGPERAEDRHGTFFRIDISAAGSPNCWSSTIEPFDSLDAALAH